MNGMCSPIPFHPVWVELCWGGGGTGPGAVRVLAVPAPDVGMPRSSQGVISTLQVDEKARRVEKSQVSANSRLECL